MLVLNKLILDRTLKTHGSYIFFMAYYIFFCAPSDVTLSEIPILVYLCSFGYSDLVDLSSDYDFSDEYILFLPTNKGKLLKGYFQNVIYTLLFILSTRIILIGLKYLFIEDYFSELVTSITQLPTILVTPAITLALIGLLQLLAIKQSNYKIIKDHTLIPIYLFVCLSIISVALIIMEFITGMSITAIKSFYQYKGLIPVICFASISIYYLTYLACKKAVKKEIVYN